jgi:NRPS condensation-like uncharacterized protein
MIFQVLRVEGALTPEIVREAVSVLQRRHPLLRAHIVDDGRYYQVEVAEYGQGTFIEEKPDVPLRVVSRVSDSQWKEIIQDECSRDFDADAHALWRIILLHSENHPQSNEIITLFPHAFSDGMSATHFVHDLLCLCSHVDNIPAVEALPLLPAAELMLPDLSSSRRFGGRGIGSDSAERKQIPWDFEDYKPLEERKARFLYFQVDEKTMDAFKKRCQREHTTVNGALLAALLMSALKERESTHHICFSFPIDLRRHCEPEVTNEHFGCYIMMVQAILTLSKKNSFWDIARTCSKEIMMQLISKRKQGFLPREFHKPFLSSTIESTLSKQYEQKHFSWGPALSDLGVLDLSEEYGPFRLKEIYQGTVQVAGLYMLLLCVAAFRGKLFCTLSFTEPLISQDTANGIADSFVSQLANASGSN